MAEKSPAVELLKGVGLVFGLHVAVVTVGYVLAAASGFELAIPLLLAFAAIGVTQFLWVLPVAAWVSARGSNEMLKGVWIAAGLTFLLNGACFVFAMS